MTSSLFALWLAVTIPVAPVALPPTPAATTDVQEAKAAAPVATVNVNTATVDQFEALPGIGPSTAKRIVSFREKNGPFKKLEDLMNVQGIGEKSFLKLRPHLTLGQADARPTKN
jgi:competence protein ComEA